MSKRVLITGASRGIGKEIARTFAKEGYELYLICKNNLTAMQEVADELHNTYGTHSYCYAADLSDSIMLSYFLETLPDMDVIINNAGISHVGLLTDMTLAEWNHIFQTNLTSVFVICQKLLPAMIRRGQGKIINISSMWGTAGASCEAAYSATKGAVIALTKALAKELGPSGIRVNCVSPGVILTDMCAAVDPQILSQMAEEAPLGRNGSPEDVAKAMEYLADADFVTGQVLSVNGGYVI